VRGNTLAFRIKVSYWVPCSTLAWACAPQQTRFQACPRKRGTWHPGALLAVGPTDLTICPISTML